MDVVCVLRRALPFLVLAACGGASASAVPDPDSTPLAVDGVPSFAIADVAVVDGAGADDEPVTRILVSDHARLCERLAAGAGLPLEEGERLFTIHVPRDGAAVTLATDRDQTLRITLGDTTKLCGPESVPPAQGSGSVSLDAHTDASSVRGAVDATFEGAARIRGRFEARRCAVASYSGIGSCPGT